MKKLKRTYTRCAGLTALVLLALLIAGSFADLPISRFLYPGHESSFGQFFAAFGELPAFALLASCGVLLIVRRGEFRPELHMILLAFGVCLIAGSVFLSIHEATDNVPALPTAVALLVTLFVDALAAFAFLFMTRGCQAKTLLRFLCTVIFVCVGIMLLINIIKVPWGRARMRLIYSTGNDTYFTNWWQAGTALKKKLVADGVSSDEFRSFPSGHTACAACAMLMILVPTICRRRSRSGCSTSTAPSLAASGSFSPAKPPAKSSLCRKKAEKSSPIQRIGELLCRYTVSGSVKS